jgi:hypothetical protein
MNRIQMLRAWHRDGCETIEYARHVLKNGQIWILYIIYDPRGTRAFGHRFALSMVIDGRTGVILGSRVVDVCLDHCFVGQNTIDAFERQMRVGYNVRPEEASDISNPINNRELMKGTPLPATKKGTYGEPPIANTYITDIGWYVAGTTTSSWSQWSQI